MNLRYVLNNWTVVSIEPYNDYYDAMMKYLVYGTMEVFVCKNLQAEYFSLSIKSVEMACSILKHFLSNWKLNLELKKNTVNLSTVSTFKWIWNLDSMRKHRVTVFITILTVFIVML